MMLKKGTLWGRLVETSEQALRSGALLPVPTDHAFIEERGVRFFVRVLSTLGRKDEARIKQDAEAKKGDLANPFQPPEKDLTVGDITDTHIAVLNKFNVVQHHLLIITRSFEDQDTLLTLRDFEALWRCMTEYSGLGFYNGGREAGASQKHKHLQVVPLPLAPTGPAVPTGPLLASVKGRSGICAIPAFTFLHSFVWLPHDPAPDPMAAAKTCFGLYGELLQRVGFRPPEASRLTLQSGPYCLLVTREWMLLVPRTQEFFEGISLNSLAFAGSLFVRNEEQLERLKTFGPMRALASVTKERQVPEGKQ
jgi:ATP adenylyltransferase